MPRKIRELLKDYRNAGFYLVKKAGKGDRRKLRHDDLSGSVILDGKEGDDAQHYQERALRKALEDLGK